MNLSPRWVETLEKYGYPSIHWSSVGRPDALDSEVLTVVKTGALVIVQPGTTRARILPIKARPQ
jgi:predicted nuclease of predicted toxin-antitoxin system